MNTPDFSDISWKLTVYIDTIVKMQPIDGMNRVQHQIKLALQKVYEQGQQHEKQQKADPKTDIPE